MRKYKISQIRVQTGNGSMGLLSFGIKQWGGGEGYGRDSNSKVPGAAYFLQANWKGRAFSVKN